MPHANTLPHPRFELSWCAPFLLALLVGCPVQNGGMDEPPRAGVPNDSCLTPMQLPPSNSLNPFDNLGATDDNVSTGECGPIGADLWFSFEAQCPGPSPKVRVSLCSSLFDTRLDVFKVNTPTCATADPIICSDDECDINNLLGSEVSFSVEHGQLYLIGVGGFNGHVGETKMGVSCENTCSEGPGNCCSANDMLGCGNEKCCEEVCNTLSSCCNSTWDDRCAEEAVTACRSLCCAADADCDDGQFCNNGLETCAANGLCVSGAPCAKGDECSESLKTCSRVLLDFESPIDLANVVAVGGTARVTKNSELPSAALEFDWSLLETAGNAYVTLRFDMGVFCPGDGLTFEIGGEDPQTIRFE